jgi:hypothetical protein
MSSVRSFIFRWRFELFLFVTALLIRLPFFFRDFMDHDESTFILMGQSVVDGYLPYDHLWDLKSPFLFYIFGLIEYIFPYSFVAIRVFGLLVIFISSLLLLRIAKQVNLPNGFLIALSYVMLSSEFGSVQGVMSEHIAVAFILAALLFFIKNKSSANFLWSGLFFGGALLCKLNYGYAILFLLVYYLINNWKRIAFTRLLTHMLLAGIGIIIPFFLVAIPFLIANKTSLFIDCVFLAPFAYGHSSGESGNVAKTWWIIVFGIILSWAAWKKSKKEHREFTIGCIILLLGTIYSFYTSGKVNGHYLIQVFPFIILLGLGILIQKNFKPALVIVALVVFITSFESIRE